MVTNPWIIIILVLILILEFFIYLGIGFLVCLGMHDDEDHPDRRFKLKTILAWPKLMIDFIRHKP
jgi:membrane-anchored glycerophosphoryl diester phosphodiesterase (GDPDase)